MSETPSSRRWIETQIFIAAFALPSSRGGYARKVDKNYKCFYGGGVRKASEIPGSTQFQRGLSSDAGTQDACAPRRPCVAARAAGAHAGAPLRIASPAAAC